MRLFFARNLGAIVHQSTSLAARIVIVGGGTAGWMCAAALSRRLAPAQLHITLVESDQIGTVGVGEATIPHLRYFNERLGFREPDFLRATHATYKLGIEFNNWGQIGEGYIHPFGVFGKDFREVDFHHLWTRYQKNHPTDSLFDYSISVLAAARGKFAYPSRKPEDLLSEYSYAFHIDASGYAAFLRRHAESWGIKRVEGKIVQVHRHTDSGDITKLSLDNGTNLEADFFIDCSGFQSLLLGKTLGAEFMDWSQWLPCNRAIAVPTASNGPPLPYTKATAHSAGWQWRIPLQHRTGNGHVYCSDYLSDDEALAILRQNLDGEALAEPRQLRFTAGRHRQTWVNNCVGIGLSSGFLEPLESTSIYLIQIAIMKLMEFFPRAGDNRVRREEFNEQMSLEYERIKDFLILHYHATRRNDSPFWNYCRTMEVPDSLRDAMETFRKTGYLKPYKYGLFMVPSWVAVLIGQGVIPESWHPAANDWDANTLHINMQRLQQQMKAAANQLPDHITAVRQHCAPGADNVEPWPKAAMSLYSVFS